MPSLGAAAAPFPPGSAAETGVVLPYGAHLWRIFHCLCITARGFPHPEEPRLHRPGHLGLCSCPNSLREFQSWLRTRYDSLGRLNASWRTAFTTREEVEPPRSFAQVPSWVDWRYLMDDVYLAGVLKW